MKNSFLDFKLALILCISLFTSIAHAQLGFCQGNSGDPIFTETFGTGTNYGPPLPTGTTTYNFISNSGPQDGQYTIGRNTFSYGWNLPSDHTIGDTNGKCLIVNASFSTGEFYRTSVNGLCQNTTYEFSAWLINILPSFICFGNGIPVNVSFEIWDNTDTNLLASGDTGDIFGTTIPAWQQYGLVFQTVTGQTSVILKMKNNGVGGCGNDLAIDDIVFKSCGDAITVEDSTNNNGVTLCSSQTPYNETLAVIPDNTVFSSHFYQWQLSTDGANWSDISGETNASFSILALTTTTYYRTKVAEFAANLSNSDCITFSDEYVITVNQAPNEPTTACWETATFSDATCSWTLTGTQPQEPTGLECWETATFNTTTCAWDVTGIQPTQPNTECWETAIFNNTSCSWEISGTQPQEPTGLECWETATFNTTTCAWDVTGIQPTQPNTECWETAIFNNTSCSWEISGTQPQEPTGLECWETAMFNTTTCNWEVTGTQPEEPTNIECWETVTFNGNTCNWEISGIQPIDFIDQSLFLCEGETLTLQAISSIENATYNWDSGEMSSFITVDTEGVYVVEVTDSCFTEIITFNVTQIATPVIESLVSDGNSIIVNLSTNGDYVFSLNGIDYQFSNVFNNRPSNLYTIYVKSNECNSVVTQEHLHFYIQKFMTPNDDDKHDFFSLNVLQYFTSTEVYIYNRYGKLLFSAINRNVNWDGTFNNKPLPSSDYWYHIIIDGKEFKGHFTLKH